MSDFINPWDLNKNQEEEEVKPKKSWFSDIFDNAEAYAKAAYANTRELGMGQDIKGTFDKIYNREYSDSDEKARLVADLQRLQNERNEYRNMFQENQEVLNQNDSMLKDFTEVGGTLQGIGTQAKDTLIGMGTGAAVGSAVPVLGTSAGAMAGAKWGNRIGAVHQAINDADMNAIDAWEKVLNEGGTPDQAEQAYKDAFWNNMPTEASDILSSLYFGGKLTNTAGNILNRALGGRLAGAVAKGAQKVSRFDLPARIGTYVANKSGQAWLGQGVGIGLSSIGNGLEERIQEPWQDYATERAVDIQRRQYDPENKLKKDVRDFSVLGEGGLLDYYTTPEGMETGWKAQKMGMLFGGASGLMTKSQFTELGTAHSDSIQSAKREADWIDKQGLLKDKGNLERYNNVKETMANIYELSEDEKADLSVEDVARMYHEYYTNLFGQGGNRQEQNAVSQADFLNEITGEETARRGLMGDTATKYIDEFGIRPDNETLVGINDNQQVLSEEQVQETLNQDEEETTGEETENKEGIKAKASKPDFFDDKTPEQAKEEKASSETENATKKKGVPDQFGNWKKIEEDDGFDHDLNNIGAEAKYENTKTGRIAHIKRTKAGYQVTDVTDPKDQGKTRNKDGKKKLLNFLQSSFANQKTKFMSDGTQEQVSQALPKEDGVISEINSDKITEDAEKNQWYNGRKIQSNKAVTLHSMQDLHDYYKTHKDLMSKDLYAEISRQMMRFGIGNANNTEVVLDLTNREAGGFGSETAVRTDPNDENSAVAKAIVRLYAGADLATAAHEMAHLGWMNLSDQDRATFTKWAEKTQGEFIAKILGMDYDQNFRSYLIEALTNRESKTSQDLWAKIKREGAVQQTLGILNGQNYGLAVEERFAWEFSNWYAQGYIKGAKPRNIIERILNKACATLQGALNLLTDTNRYLNGENGYNGGDINNIFTNMSTRGIGQQRQTVAPQEQVETVTRMDYAPETGYDLAQGLPNVADSELGFNLDEEPEQNLSGNYGTTRVNQKAERIAQEKTKTGYGEGVANNNETLEQYRERMKKEAEQKKEEKKQNYTPTTQYKPKERNRKIGGYEQTSPQGETLEQYRKREAEEVEKYKVPTSLKGVRKLLTIVKNRKEGWQRALQSLKQIDPRKFRSIKTQIGNDLWGVSEDYVNDGNDLWGQPQQRSLFGKEFEETKSEPKTEVEETTEETKKTNTVEEPSLFDNQTEQVSEETDQGDKNPNKSVENSNLTSDNQNATMTENQSKQEVAESGETENTRGTENLQGNVGEVQRGGSVRQGNDNRTGEGRVGQNSVEERSEGNGKDISLLKNSKFKSVYNARKEKKTEVKDWRDLSDSDQAKQVYVDALNASKEANKDYGVYVSEQTVESLKDCKVVLHKNKMAGFAITPDGNIVGVFSNPKNPIRGILNDMIFIAHMMGGNSMDCFGSFLLHGYRACGFTPVARTTFDEAYYPADNPANATIRKEKPDVFFLVKDNDNNTAYLDKMNKGEYENNQIAIDDIPLIDSEDSYGDALGFQGQVLKEIQKKENKNKSTKEVADSLRPKEETATETQETTEQTKDNQTEEDAAKTDKSETTNTENSVKEEAIHKFAKKWRPENQTPAKVLKSKGYRFNEKQKDSAMEYKIKILGVLKGDDVLNKLGEEKEDLENKVKECKSQFEDALAHGKSTEEITRNWNLYKYLLEYVKDAEKVMSNIQEKQNKSQTETPVQTSTVEQPVATKSEPVETETNNVQPQEQKRNPLSPIPEGEEFEKEVAEAKQTVLNEYLNWYRKFLKDVRKIKDINDEKGKNEFGHEWGLIPSDEMLEKCKEDNLKTFMYFRDRFFNGQWSFDWNKNGIRKEALWALDRDKFLSHKQYSNWDARNTGKTDFYFLSQKNAKQVYKDFIAPEMAEEKADIWEDYADGNITREEALNYEEESEEEEKENTEVEGQTSTNEQKEEKEGYKDPKIMKYIPKDKQEAVSFTDIDGDDGSYWVYLKEGWCNGEDRGTGIVHERTLKEVKDKARNITRVEDMPEKQEIKEKSREELIEESVERYKKMPRQQVEDSLNALVRAGVPQDFADEIRNKLDNKTKTTPQTVNENVIKTNKKIDKKTRDKIVDTITQNVDGDGNGTIGDLWKDLSRMKENAPEGSLEKFIDKLKEEYIKLYSIAKTLGDKNLEKIIDGSLQRVVRLDPIGFPFELDFNNKKELEKYFPDFVGYKSLKEYYKKNYNFDTDKFIQEAKNEAKEIDLTTMPKISNAYMIANEIYDPHKFAAENAANEVRNKFSKQNTGNTQQNESTTKTTTEAKPEAKKTTIDKSDKNYQKAVELVIKNRGMSTTGLRFALENEGIKLGRDKVEQYLVQMENDGIVEHGDEGSLRMLKKNPRTKMQEAGQNAENQTLLTPQVEEELENLFWKLIRKKQFHGMDSRWESGSLDYYKSLSNRRQGKEFNPEFIKGDKAFLNAIKNVNDYIHEKFPQYKNVYRGVDGHWRFEFSDKDANFINGFEKLNGKTLDTTLDKILKHDNLYKFYSKLKGMPVHLVRNTKMQELMEDTENQYYAMYDPDERAIYINSDMFESSDELRKSLLHEIQHAIQDIEGFANGTNDNAYNNDYDFSEGEKQAVLTEKRSNMSDEELRQNPRSKTLNPNEKTIIQEQRPVKKVAKTDTKMQSQGEQQKADINTPQFKKWFNGSVVKNKDGSPKVYYRGLNGEYDVNKQSPVTWVSPSIDQAYSYSDNSKHVYPVYVSIKNPANIGNSMSQMTMQQFVDNRLNPLITQAYRNKAITKEQGLQFFDTLDELANKSGKDFKRVYEWYNNNNEIIDILKEAGYDALLTEEDNQETYGVFDKGDVKSIYNNGTFDRNNPDIRFQSSGNQNTQAKYGYIDKQKDIYSVTFTKSAQKNGENQKKIAFYRNNKSYWRENKDAQTGSITFTRALPYQQHQKTIIYDEINGKKVGKRKKAKWREYYEAFKDHVIKWLFNDKHFLEKAARNVGAIEAYMRMMVMKDQGAVAGAAIEDGIVKHNGKNGERTKSLNSIIEAVGEENQTDFLNYCEAYRVLDLEKRNIYQKMTPKDARDEIARVKRSKNAKLFEQQRQYFVEYNHELLWVLVDGGFITEKQYDNFIKIDPNFIPLAKNMDELEGYVDGFRDSKTMINVAHPMHKIGTSMREVANPFLEMQKRTVEYYVKASRNKAGHIFVHDIAEAIAQNAKGDVVAQNQGMVRKLASRDKNGKPISHDNKQYVFYVWENGEKQYYQVADREIYIALKSFDAEQMGALSKIMNATAGKASRLVRNTATMTPDFGLRNLVRDNMEAFISSEHGFLPLVDSLWGMYQMANDTQWFKEYQRMNGEHLSLNRDGEDVATVEHDIKDNVKFYKTIVPLFKKDLHEFMDKDRSKPARAKSLLKLVALDIVPLQSIYKANKRLNDYLETGTRIGEYRNARMGYKGLKGRLFETSGSTIWTTDMDLSRAKNTEMIAAYKSKDITLNFGQHGVLGKELNRYIPFFNASLQGIYKLGNTLDDMIHAEDARRRQELMFKCALMGAMGMAAALAGQGDDDYDEAPDYEHENFWILPNGIRIPKDQLFGKLIGGTVEKATAQYLKDGDVKKLELVQDILGNFAIDKCVPALVDLAMGLYGDEGYDTFRKKPVVPSYMVDWFGYQKKDLSTSKLAADISEGLLNVFGVDVAAKKIDFVFSKTLSNLGNYTKGLYDLGTNPNERMTRGAEPEDKGGFAERSKELPYPLNTIIGTFATNRNTFQSVSDFYNRYKELKKFEHAPERMSKAEKKVWEAYKKAYKDDKKYRDALKAIKADKSLTGAQKRERADKIFKQQIRMARKLRDYEKKQGLV